VTKGQGKSIVVIITPHLQVLRAPIRNLSRIIQMINLELGGQEVTGVIVDLGLNIIILLVEKMPNLVNFPGWFCLGSKMEMILLMVVVDLSLTGGMS